MRRYYFHDGREQKGPYTTEELQKFDIRPETPIWHEGLDTWTQAREVFDITSIPPPFIRTQIAPANEPKIKDKTWFEENPILSAVLGLLALVALIEPRSTMLIIGLAFASFVISKLAKAFFVLIVLLLLIGMGVIIYMQNSSLENQIKYQHVKHNYVR